MIYGKEKSEERERFIYQNLCIFTRKSWKRLRVCWTIRVKIWERKRNNVQILRDGSRLILDEITKSAGLSRRAEIYGVNFVDSPVETVLILLHVPVYHFSSSRFALGNKLSKIHTPLFQYIDKLFTYVFYIITWRRIENVTFETCYYSIEIIFFHNFFFFCNKIVPPN